MTEYLTSRTITRECHLAKIRPFYADEQVKVLIGMRRCGKSVLLRQIIQEIEASGVASDHIMYFNFELLDHVELRTALSLATHVSERITDKGKYYLFLDEVQRVREFEDAVNSLRAKHNISIFVTGSNSSLLSGELATLLAGRYISFEITPFSFAETCAFSQAQESDYPSLFWDYLEWGGLPHRFAFANSDDVGAYLRDVYASIVQRDIIERVGIKDIALFDTVFSFIVSNISNVFSAKSVANFLKSQSRTISHETLYNYLSHIVSAILARKVGRYDIRGKQTLATAAKYYVTDLGLSQVVASSDRIAIGARLENIVLNELILRGYNVKIGQNADKEVDFVATRGSQKEYFQVSYLLAEQATIDREFGAFDSIKDNFPKTLLTLDQFDMSRDGICHRNIISWLLDK